MSLAFRALETLVQHSFSPVTETYRIYNFYTCVKYNNNDNSISVACVKGYYPSLNPNVFYCTVNKFLDQDAVLLNRFNGILYDIVPPIKEEDKYKPKKEVHFNL